MEEKIISNNKAAYHEYFVTEKYEAGIVLDGGEVKSARQNKVNLKDSFCFLKDGEIFIKNMHISTYDKAGAYNEKNPLRDRKLLLHKSEIIKIAAKVSQKGMTLVPLKMYFKQSLIKIELGLCKGKHTFDKKRDLAEKDIKREKERAISDYKKRN